MSNPALRDLRLPDVLRERLRCPKCRSELAGDLSRLVCEGAQCGLRFEAIGDVPALFDPEQSLFSMENQRSESDSDSGLSGLKKRVNELLPSLDRNVSAVGNLQRIHDLILDSESRATVLNVGDKHPSSVWRSIRDHERVDVAELDVRQSALTNLLSDPIRLPFEDETFDCVLLIAILEHVIDPEACVAEVHRVLKPGGLVYSDAPFLLEVHAGAFDYQRWTPVGHRNLFRRFECIDLGVTQGPAVSLAHSIQSFLLSFVRRDLARFAIKAASRLGLFWLRYIDLFLGKQPGALDSALGTYFIGRKDGRDRDAREVIEAYAGITPDLYRR